MDGRKTFVQNNHSVTVKLNERVVVTHNLSLQSVEVVRRLQDVPVAEIEARDRLDDLWLSHIDHEILPEYGVLSADLRDLS